MLWLQFRYCLSCTLIFVFKKWPGLLPHSAPRHYLEQPYVWKQTIAWAYNFRLNTIPSLANMAHRYFQNISFGKKSNVRGVAPHSAALLKRMPCHHFSYCTEKAGVTPEGEGGQKVTKPSTSVNPNVSGAPPGAYVHRVQEVQLHWGP